MRNTRRCLNNARACDCIMDNARLMLPRCSECEAVCNIRNIGIIHHHLATLPTSEVTSAADD